MVIVPTLAEVLFALSGCLALAPLILLDAAVDASSSAADLEAKPF